VFPVRHPDNLTHELTNDTLVEDEDEADRFLTGREGDHLMTRFQ
jgi:hypothetical protein